MLRYFEPDRLKVASRDLTNLPLLEVMAETKIPMILSTGMGGKPELDRALEVITRYHSNVAILHCLSQYPSEYKNINLNTIPFLQKEYPEYTIGYSDHSIGIVVPAAAVALGARIIEKHITLDRNMKGTDHKGSLGSDGIWRMVRDIRNIEKSMGEEGMFISDAVSSARTKLERSLATARAIGKGEVINETDLHMLSPGDGFKWNEREQVVGKTATENIPEDEIIYKHMIK
jgi:sialic acid synthase